MNVIGLTKEVRTFRDLKTENTPKMMSEMS